MINLNLLELYDIAAANNIDVDHINLKTMTAFSLPGNIVIDLSQLKTLAETKVCMAHELGHEMKSAFYNIKNIFETRERQEERATRWAVDALIPVERLKQAFKEGYSEVYELADYFDVTEDFVRDAVRIHKLRGDL